MQVHPGPRQVRLSEEALHLLDNLGNLYPQFRHSEQKSKQLGQRTNYSQLIVALARHGEEVLSPGNTGGNNVEQPTPADHEVRCMHIYLSIRREKHDTIYRYITSFNGSSCANYGNKGVLNTPV